MGDKNQDHATITALQKRIAALQKSLSHTEQYAVIVFEGLDAAGKGGSIKRLTARLDPAGYEVIAISAPSRSEKKRHYLWRFMQKIPEKGKLAIFDRSWYGRVLVERVEGFCTDREWGRAYGEINTFERLLYDDDAVIIKIWLSVSEDEQLRRFRERELNPKKRYKITAEDWRNRSRRTWYDEAAEEMFRLTSTDYAPWHIIDGDDKKRARQEVLTLVAEALEEALQTNSLPG